MFTVKINEIKSFVRADTDRTRYDLLQSMIKIDGLKSRHLILLQMM